MIWRAYHNALPVKERLVARQIITNPTCAHCEDAETVAHLFFLCPAAQDVWSRLPCKGQVNFENISNFAEGWRKVMRSTGLPPTGVTSENLAAWIVWSIWLARNQVIFREEQTSAQEVVTMATRLAREWTQAQQKPEHDKTRLTSTWEGPRQELICRSDAAWNKEGRQAGVAWEFLSNGKERIYSGSQTFSNVKSPLVAEGLALLTAMEAAILMDFKQISFESDSSRLMTAIKEGATVSDLHGILSDIASLSLSFNSVSFY